MLNLPDEILREIGKFLGQKEANRLTRTCRRFHLLFQNDVNTRLLEDLQQGVVYAGQNHELEEKLEPIMKHRPDLLFKKSKIIDGTGRIFNDNLI